MIGRFPFMKLRVTCKFTFQNNFSLSNVVILWLKTVHQLTNGLGCSLIHFSGPGYYRQKKIKLVLEQYLKLDLRSESINYTALCFDHHECSSFELINF